MSDFLSKQIKKQSARTKEKLLETLGKATRTTDDVFEQYSNNFSKQSRSAERLSRDLKIYAAATKAFVAAQKTVHEALRELYEPDWPERAQVLAISQSHDLVADELEKNINDGVIPALNNYVGQFPELKNKIAKRGRKMVDFDSARHEHTSLKASSKKGEDDPKVQKAAQELQQAETMYRELNEYLLDALPALYDSRITFFLHNVQAMLDAETKYHTEAAKLNKTLIAQVDVLGNALESLRVPRDTTPPPPPPPPSSTVATQRPRTPSDGAKSNDTETAPQRPVPPSTPTKESPTTDENAKPTNNEKPEGIYPAISNNPFDDSDEEKKETPVARARNLDANKSVQDNPEEKVLYRVRATHRYSAEDTDELSFEAGEILVVLESNEELDQGWLLGQRVRDNARGVFPANFTKTI